MHFTQSKFLRRALDRKKRGQIEKIQTAFPRDGVEINFYLPCMLRALVFLISIFGFSNLKAQINPCLASDTIKVVVIGSSTAAGAGASVSDSAWVNRYRAYLQSINPANQVINLARGGYNTWRLMPDYFSAPANRPSPDTLRNISHALRQNPDVIIINLPSNDAAIGTGVNQQMSNFIHMDSLSAQMGVPFWLSTTQPRNGSATFKNIQLAVRDSIFSRFGTRAIDFWQGIADSTNSIDPYYDSGDGVHLNDLGHALLFQRVISSGVTDSTISPYNGIDLSAGSPQCLNCETCGSSVQQISFTIQNQGAINSSPNLTAQLIRENLITGQLDTFSQSGLNVLSCNSISLTENLDLSSGGSWRFHSLIIDPNDSIIFNNSSSPADLILKARPIVSFMDTILCPGDTAYLSAFSNDEYRWFQSSQSDSALHVGDSIPWSTGQGDSVFLQAFRGPFYNIAAVESASSSNIQWNGCMFNLIAFADTIHLDSLNFTAGSTSNLAVEWRSIASDYRGHENDSSLWSSPLRDSIYGAITDSTYLLNFGAIKILPYDTLGVYLYLKDPNQRLAYLSAGQHKAYGDSVFQVEVGSGIAAHFGTIYQPRHFKGQFYYHFGSKPEGQCQSERLLMRVHEQAPSLSLGPDSLHPIQHDLKLYLGADFSNVIWSTNAVGDSLLIPAFSYQAGDSIHIIVRAEDSLGCLESDTLIVYFSDNVSTSDNILKSLNFYPNPSSGVLKVHNPFALNFSLKIIDSQGRIRFSGNYAQKEEAWDLSLKRGLYYLLISEGDKQRVEPWVLQ